MASPLPHRRPLYVVLLIVGTAIGLPVIYWRLTRLPPPLPGRAPSTFTGAILGTPYTIDIVTPEPLSAAAYSDLHTRLQGTLDDTHQRLSLHAADSEVSRLNAWQTTAPLALSAPTWAVLSLAQQVSAQSDGAFDVTLRPVIEAWGFGLEESLRDPTPAEVALLMAHIGTEKLHLHPTDGTLWKEDPDLQVDVSPILRGHAVDQASRLLSGEPHVLAYRVEVGSEVRARGEDAYGHLWRVILELPPSQAGKEGVVLRDAAVAIAGIPTNHYEVDGERLAFTLDARSGRPLQHALAAVAVIHAEAAWADAYASAIHILGPTDGMALAEALRLPALFWVRSPEGDDTVRWEPRMTSTFAAYRVTEAQD